MICLSNQRYVPCVLAYADGFQALSEERLSEAAQAAIGKLGEIKVSLTAGSKMRDTIVTPITANTQLGPMPEKSKMVMLEKTVT